MVLEYQFLLKQEFLHFREPYFWVRSRNEFWLLNVTSILSSTKSQSCIQLTKLNFHSVLVKPCLLMFSLNVLKIASLLPSFVASKLALASEFRDYYTFSNTNCLCKPFYIVKIKTLLKESEIEKD